MITDELKKAFRFHMQNPKRELFRDKRGPFYAYPIGQHASAALARARQDVAEGKKRYPAPIKPVTNPANAKGHRWIENPANMGLRFVGYADELVKLDHRGWFTDPDGFETIRGTVYQLPGRNGKARYVAAHDDPCNADADSNGPAYVNFSDIYESDFESEMVSAIATIGKQYRSADMMKPGYWAESAHETARKYAARVADSFAELQAEQEREYQTAWQAGSLYADAMQEVKETRQEVLAILKERKAVKTDSAQYPALCVAIRARVQSLISDLRQAQETARELMSGDHERFYFWTGDKRLQDAFNEGAGETVLA